jgi:hypothetical protein
MRNNQLLLQKNLNNSSQLGGSKGGQRNIDIEWNRMCLPLG